MKYLKIGISPVLANLIKNRTFFEVLESHVFWTFTLLNDFSNETPVFRFLGFKEESHKTPDSPWLFYRIDLQTSNFSKNNGGSLNLPVGGSHLWCYAITAHVEELPTFKNNAKNKTFDPNFSRLPKVLKIIMLKLQILAERKAVQNSWNTTIVMFGN